MNSRSGIYGILYAYYYCASPVARLAHQSLTHLMDNSADHLTSPRLPTAPPIYSYYTTCPVQFLKFHHVQD